MPKKDTSTKMTPNSVNTNPWVETAPKAPAAPGKSSAGKPAKASGKAKPKK